MGYGDFVMATAEVKAFHNKTGLKPRLEVEKSQRKQYEEVFKYNPYIGDDYVLKNKKGNRPYIETTINGRLIYNPNFKAVKGDLHLGVKKVTQDYVLIDPYTKPGWSLNKAWPIERWETLSSKIYHVVQPLYGKPKLKNAQGVKTDNIRQAFKLLLNAKLFIGTDGALHHAAAALGVPSIVLWSGMTHPDTLGYDDHINIRANNSPPCGSLFKCHHCESMMSLIEVEQVYEASQRYLAS